ncbi:MAG: hypothetical protein JSS68_15045 [Actinobacteria bacterium]|nr:hypothetical protein [Actinomycetota bacterium]
MATTTPTDSAGQKAVQQTIKNSGTNLADLKAEFTKFKYARMPLESDWFLNSAFFVGQQWLFWNHGRLDRPRLAKWRVTAVDNRMLSLITARVAKKVKTRPQFVATPYTGKDSDLDAAKVTEKVIDFDWDYLELQQKLYEAQLLADVTGAGLWKIHWDGTLGEKAEVIVDQNGQPQLDANGQIMKADQIESIFGGTLPAGLNVKTIATGDVVVEVVTPFQFYPDPIAKSFGEVERAFEENIHSPDYVKQRYGVDLPADSEVPAGPVEARMFSSLMPAGGVGYKGVLVHEFWAKPCPTYPTGKHVVWAKDQVLVDEDNPVDPMPYVMFSGIKVPNRFWPTAVATQLRGPQISLNKLASQIQENAERLGNPSLLKNRYSNVEYTGVPGEEVLFDGTVPEAAPSFLAPPGMPGYVLEERQRIIESMIEISGVHEVSNATVPSGVTAAAAINLLQEADDTRIGPEVQDMEFGLGQAGTKIARLRALFNTDQRLIRIAGDDEAWDISEFRGTMMGREPTVACQAGSAMPRSKAAQQASMMEVLQTSFQYGLIPAQRDLRRFFKEYEVGGLDALFTQLSMTESQVQRENHELAQGVAMNINAFDEDQDHIDGHEEFQRTARYMQLPEQVKQLVEMHVNAHRERLVQKANMQAEAMAQAHQAEVGQQHAMALEQQAHQGAVNIAEAHAKPQPEARSGGWTKHPTKGQ